MDENERQALLIVRDALDLEHEAREHFIETRCAGDAALRARVVSLLQRIGVAEDDASEALSNEPVESLIGTCLGPFRVIERIGRGGMGVVYRGQRDDADFAQEVALKLVRRGFDFDDVQARFLRERRILARLSHPNLARFIDGGVAPDGRPWFALEFVRGETITRWCDARRFGLRARVRVFLAVCEAVQYAHGQLIVHRDLKPANVLVDGAGSVRLLDFGIARLLGGEDRTPALTAIGSRYAFTPEYAAPEQFGGGDVGVAADVYALGVMLYELLAGMLPYAMDRGDHVAAERIARETPPQPLAQAIGRDASSQAQRLAARASSLRNYRNRVRGDLSRIVGKALEKEPERRYASVEAFAGDLSRWLAGAPVKISGNGFGYRLGKFVKRNAMAVALVSALTLGLVLTTVWALRAAYLEYGQRQAAMAEVARGGAVRDYVMLMFRSAAAEHDASNLTAREVLERGADGIFERFRDEPQTGQTTALMLAELYSALDDSQGAAPLLERLLAWPGIENNPEIQASAQYQLGDIRFQQGRLSESRALLDLAQAFWQRQPARFQEPLTRSRIMQGRLERGEGRLDESIRTLRAGADARSAFLGAPDSEVGAMLISLSISLSRAERQSDAMQAADEACRVFEALGMEHSSPGLAALANRSMIAWSAGKREEALADLHRVGGLRQSLYGPSTELAKVRSMTAGMLARLGRYAEAMPIFEEALRMGIEFGGETGRVADDTRRRMIEAHLEAQHADAAAPLVDALVANAVAASGERAIDTGVGYALRARVRAAQGRMPEAMQDADAATAILLEHGTAGEPHLKSLRTWRDGLKPVP